MNSLLRKLRAATRPLHTELENVSWGGKIMDGTLTEPEYAKLIDWQRRVHESLEHQVMGFSAGDYRYRPRFTLSTPKSESTPDRATAIGILYVLEGASLGGSVIYRKLISNPRLTACAPFDFYREQSEWGLAQWRKYLASLDGLHLSEGEIDRAVEAAVATFRKFLVEWRAQSV
ncbi:heme oxygenase [Lewinella aquimaris]|uniref:Heme oxygenase n=1 Tax=Neolewinella aquimaris TaxID=1835722 RepID=A0A840E3N4_9BACT|nr:biliverdin-producing heme oxygenase [Neolewinella aquimaris]MBB4080194.1 heme oxygenase [Neolewinella aquimaris]